MPSTPVDDHTEEFEQLAGLSALDVLEGDELARFELHAAHCERCRLMVRLDREALALAAPEMDPSPDFKARLMQRAALELEQQEPIPLRRPPNVIPLWRRSPWASALAAVFVVALVSAGAFTYENQVVASYALAGTLRGTAVVKVHRSGAAELDLSDVEAPPPGFLYEAWIIPQGGQPIPAGITASGDAQLPLNGLSNGSTVAITQERNRVEAPTGQPLMVTTVQL
jgi:anti-sigma-K factor RskA